MGTFEMIMIMAVIAAISFTYYCFMCRVLTIYNKDIQYKMNELLSDTFALISKDLNTLYKENREIENLQRRSVELISHKIKKLSLQIDEMKTDIDKVADNVNDISVSSTTVTEPVTEPVEEERYITYEEMVKDFQADRQIDYKHQVARLKKELEVLEERFDNAVRNNIKLNDENLMLKSELEVMKAVKLLYDTELVSEINAGAPKENETVTVNG